jgi:hypothetical protein
MQGQNSIDSQSSIWSSEVGRDADNNMNKNSRGDQYKE